MADIVILYDSLRGNTGRLTAALEEILTAAGHQVKTFKPKEIDLDAVAAADCLLIGGPTYHKGLIKTMEPVLFQLEKLDLKGKPGAAFASFGWSGESLGLIEDTMKNLYGIDLVVPGIKVKQTPVAAKVKKEIEPFATAIIEALK
jgi:flavorubredoxin